jgi:putative drug exporter of the RND superfamily
MPNKAPSRWLRIALPLLLVVAWFAVGGIGGPYFGRIEEVSEVDLTAFLPESAEATKVADKLGEFSDDDTLTAVMVFEADKVLSASQKVTIERAVILAAETEGVLGEVSPPIFSDDKKAAYAVASVQTEGELEKAVTGIRNELKEADLINVNHYVTGPAGFAADLNVAFAGIDGILLLTALAVVFVILLFVYRSVLLPFVVLLTSIFALSASILIVFTLAKLDVIQLNGQVQGILFILVIGAATDYSLLYVSRYREALYAKRLSWHATVAAYKGAFEPIIASGGTVIVGLLCLLLSDLASNKALGPVGSIGILMAVASALTFLPATLLLLGRGAFWPVVPRSSSQARQAHKAKLERGFWHKIGERVRLNPRPIWVVTAIILLIAAAMAPQIKADGVAQSDLISGYSEAREGQEVLGQHFSSGSGSPAQILVHQNLMDETVKIVDGTRGIDGVNVTATDVESGFAPLGESKKEIETEIRNKIEAQRASVPPMALAQMPSAEQMVRDVYPFKGALPIVKDNEVLLQATLTDDPDSEAAKATIERLRSRLYEADILAQVGGTTAAQLDSNTASLRDRAIIIPAVLFAITIILMLLLRSVLAPLLLLATTVLSFAASIGVAALLFNNFLGFPGADPSVLLYSFVFLVALGIDYNIFLMTRVREESLKSGTSKGVIKGLVITGGVITSAGIVLAATFAALSVIPILFLFQLAFIVAFGVLLDTFVVRSLLVPALIKDIGATVWWPSRMKK